MAVFDPRVPDFLKETVPYFLDREIAILQTPQLPLPDRPDLGGEGCRSDSGAVLPDGGGAGDTCKPRVFSVTGATDAWQSIEVKTCIVQRGWYTANGSCGARAVCSTCRMTCFRCALRRLSGQIYLPRGFHDVQSVATCLPERVSRATPRKPTKDSTNALRSRHRWCRSCRTPLKAEGSFMC